MDTQYSLYVCEGYYVNETRVDVNRHCQLGNSGIFRTPFAKVGDLYRDMQKEHGRCTGKMYVDRGGKPVWVGWVFQKRDKYTDSKKSFLLETWVNFYATNPQGA
jgi:hypothetical protein